ncbi:P-II family nitrogen regulator [Nesterenkonia sp. HG001]|uniref:P-II family nitrogen regulator n=1 Tax=Nesterenkonia sp. HG001 TaxID=2983207 RepID=UPI002AC5C316|nr:transcriptional regulator [Nesterenkonia sp. HG001]MDZ5078806.1 transcriptional regulator [Nesterenkonia sp. HG001]
MMSQKAVFVVIPDDREERAIALVEDAGATGVTALSARGVGKHARKTFFGARFSGAQSALIMLVPEDKVTPIMSCLDEVIYEGQEAHGICFTVPVEQISPPEPSTGSS